jgi:hypothetical protein
MIVKIKFICNVRVHHLEILDLDMDVNLQVLEGHYLAKTLAVEVEHYVDPESRHLNSFMKRQILLIQLLPVFEGNNCRRAPCTTTVWSLQLHTTLVNGWQLLISIT